MALEFVRATEGAALASARWMGRGDSKAADHAATEYLRRALSTINFNGTVVIGEGERDEAPMLFIGEKVGSGDGPELDIAVDPLEGTDLTATGRPNALCVIAAAPKGSFLNAPDTYMYKIACGPEAKGSIDISDTVSNNIKHVAEALDKDLDDMNVVILDRERHKELIKEVRALGARITLIPDGDVAAAIATCIPDSGVDLLIGTGGAPEGVLAAAALRCCGGDFQGQLRFRNNGERERAIKMNIDPPERVFAITDLAAGDNILFSATGVTDGSMLKGVMFTRKGAQSNSIVMRSQSGTIRHITTQHHFKKKPVY